MLFEALGDVQALPSPGNHAALAERTFLPLQRPLGPAMFGTTVA